MIPHNALIVLRDVRWSAKIFQRNFRPGHCGPIFGDYSDSNMPSVTRAPFPTPFIRVLKRTGPPLRSDQVSYVPAEFHGQPQTDSHTV